MMTGALACESRSRLVVSERISPQQWDAYVAGRPDASGYHRSGWQAVIQRAFGHQPIALAVLAGDTVVGVLPLIAFKSGLFGRFFVSMPFLNYGGVLADSPEAEGALLDAAVERARVHRARHIELRHQRQIYPALQARHHKVAMILPLERHEDEQWKALDRKVRNQVRKAQKSHLRVLHGGPELLDAFYTVFARNMRDLGTPVYGIRFFREIFATFPATARAFIVRLGEQTVAASIVYSDRGTTEVPWASSIREFNPLCPNVLLYWEMLRFAIGRGSRLFDFGRCTPFESTYEFKRQWGAQPRELVWEYWVGDGQGLPDLTPKNPRFQRAIAAWRRLPVGITTTVGPLIVRNIP